MEGALRFSGGSIWLQPRKELWASHAAKKHNSGRFCNKGTTSVGPLKPLKREGL